MIRIYIDWNVMSQMKAGQHTGFSEIIRDNEKFLKFYSTSHIGDIAASSQGADNRDNILSDLDFISRLTDNFCVFNTGREVVMEKRVPLDIYEERNDMGGIFDLLDSDVPDEALSPEDLDFRKMLAPFLEVLKNQASDEVFQRTFEDPKKAEQMRTFLPGLEGNYTNAGVFNAILKMFKGLNDKAHYKLLRNTVQNGLEINRDRIYNTEDPYAMMNKAYKKKGIVLPDMLVPNEYAPDWYNEISNEYIRLDMHGYQEDKITVGKGRKQTFRNTNEDAFHTAFATTCDFYITNDQKNLKKAKVIYKKFSVNTEVMSPDELVEHYNTALHFKGEKFLQMIPAIVEHDTPTVSHDGLRQSYYTSLYIFDYFNKVMVIQDELASARPFFVLARVKPTNNKSLYEQELKSLIGKLLSLFGSDLKGAGVYLASDKVQINASNWRGRKWNYQGMQYQLRFEQENLRMYVLFNESVATETERQRE